MNYIFWLILSGIGFAIGEFWSKKFALEPKVISVVWLLLAYTAGVLFWLPAIMQKNQLSIVGVMWTIFGTLITVAIGVLIFKEKLGLTGTIGIVFAVIALIFLSKS